MASSLVSRNDATRVNGNVFNGTPVDINQTVRGSNFYFAICAIMGLVSLVVLGVSYTKPRRDRIFFYITAALNFTAFIAYFTMGSNLGWAPINVEFVRSNPKVAGLNRSVFYARYIDWVITTPLLLMDLLLTAGMPWTTIFWVIFVDEVMIITGLIGALVSTRYKWGFFTIGCVAMLYVFYELAFVARRHANALGKDVGRVFTTCGVLTLVVWLCYPIAWGLSEGGNVIAPDSEAVFYGVLDFLAKPVFSIALIYGHWKISPDRLGLRMREVGVTSKRDLEEKHYVREEPRQNIGIGGGHTTTTTGPTLAAVGTGSNRQATGHASHATGYAPVHEDTTTESGSHLATQRV